MVERKLGRGLEFLMSSTLGSEPGEEVVQVAVDRLVPNRHQPRMEFVEEDLEELAVSLRSSGMLQPILARRQGEHFEVIAGERRLRAARRAGLEKVPVLLRDVEEGQLLVLALVENLQRADLNPLEKARALKELQVRGGWTQEEVARQVAMSRSAVANLVRLLELPAPVQAYVSRGTLSMGHARALLGLEDAEAMELLAERCLREGLSVREVEQIVQEHQAGRASGGGPETEGRGAGAQRARKGPPSWLRDLEEQLGTALQTRVRIRYGRRRGEVKIEFYGRDEFERLHRVLLRAAEPGSAPAAPGVGEGAGG